MKDLSEHFNRIITKARGIADSEGVNVSLGISHNGQTEVWDSGERELSFIASSSKLFTFACFAKLQEAGDLSFDQPVAKWIDKEVLSRIVHPETDLSLLTIEALLSHTSGIPDYYKAKKLLAGSVESQTRDDPGWDFQDVVEISSGMKKIVAPTKKTHYSGTNYQLLEQVLNSIYGSFDEALRELIAKPLGLENTFVYRDKRASKIDSIQPLKYGSEKYFGFSRMASLGAEGGIVSTSKDTLKFLDAVFKGNFLSSEITDYWLSQKYRFRFGIDYGLGIMFFKSGLFFGSRHLVGHIGATSHIAAHDLETGVSYVVTVNDFKGHKTSLKILRGLTRQIV